jgi:hypothetical protein
MLDSVRDASEEDKNEKRESRGGELHRCLWVKCPRKLHLESIN